MSHLLFNQSLISAEQLTPQLLSTMFYLADKYKQQLANKGILDVLPDKIMASLFFEPSTRTRLSFETAMIRLGGKIIGFSDASTSSTSKGETLEDTIKMVMQYADIITIRHPQKGAAKQASTVSTKPIINAGDGDGEHPTQACLDTYTIFTQKQTLSGLKVAFVGDLKFGRTVHSLVQVLNQYNHNHFFFVSPKNLALPSWVLGKLKPNSYIETENLEEILPIADVLYVTRIQKERFTSEAEYNQYKGVYIINSEVMSKFNPQGMILHPLPRVDEITTEVDQDPRAFYFVQAKNGMYIRMAILTMLLKTEY